MPIKQQAFLYFLPQIREIFPFRKHFFCCCYNTDRQNLSNEIIKIYSNRKVKTYYSVDGATVQDLRMEAWFLYAKISGLFNEVFPIVSFLCLKKFVLWHISMDYLSFGIIVDCSKMQICTLASSGIALDFL